LGNSPISDKVDKDAKNSIRKVVCQVYFAGEGDCLLCRSTPECDEIVESTMSLVSQLASERENTPPNQYRVKPDCLTLVGQGIKPIGIIFQILDR
jgi:hypothetical protein